MDRHRLYFLWYRSGCASCFPLTCCVYVCMGVCCWSAIGCTVAWAVIMSSKVWGHDPCTYAPPPAPPVPPATPSLEVGWGVATPLSAVCLTFVALSCWWNMMLLVGHDDDKSTDAGGGTAEMRIFCLCNVPCGLVALGTAIAMLVIGGPGLAQLSPGADGSPLLLMLIGGSAGLGVWLCGLFLPGDGGCQERSAAGCERIRNTTRWLMCGTCWAMRRRGALLERRARESEQVVQVSIQKRHPKDSEPASELGIPLAGTSWQDKSSQECDDCGGPMDYTLTFEADGYFLCVGDASDLEGSKWVGRWTVRAGEIILTVSHCFRTDNVHDEGSWSACPQSVLTIFPGAVKRSLSTVDCTFAFEGRAAFESSWVRLEQNV